MNDCVSRPRRQRPSAGTRARGRAGAKRLGAALAFLVTGVLGGVLGAAPGAIAQPAPAWTPAPAQVDVFQPGERERQQLREQLRGERLRPGTAARGGPMGAVGREPLSPEERDALRQHVRKLAPPRHGP